MNLTAREIEVLKLVATGHSAEQAAKKLRLSKRTVEVHIRTARLKLGATNATHAVVLALKQKLFRLRDIES
ncbi:DNA-binding CsgD family transcriptional regulator [Afipia massiliensis]|uniref:DNA-binding CsgD family transcriptional regulator n=1 Tax=Afipia massiliensis TaxID=211460 RepID=A0A840N5E2_9BRAD|nr:helix-turn-helix transcriptional regulator [Afipia massiliensis]MBB5053048.1 DNA-binding CsgD family transcriptional regulator [Afipia massiliensis]